ncbi:MAG: hypothetical protein GOV00_03980 [Candidatus Altiarchaeota archaeon]|nr:hypothetical protein [Candidatus Altiarchaeota archaeon]
MVQLKVWARVGPTEKGDAVITALESFFPELDFKVEQDIAVGKGKGKDLLDALRQKIWAKQILDTAREMLLRRIDGDLTELLIHKQAAYAKKMVLVNGDSGSPLGAIHIEIQSKQLEAIIEWIAPETVKGEPVKGIIAKLE